MTTLIRELDESLKLGLKGNRRWFRADVAHGIEVSEGEAFIDLKDGQTIIKGYSVITKGAALGHNMLVDDVTLNQVIEQGNKAKNGIKSRFDHPNASNTSMGTFIGRSKNFRREGNLVRADLHLSEAAKESPNGDLHSYVLALAKEDPQAFGASIVFRGEHECQKDEKGKERKDQPMLVRIDKLLASDVVDSPAANPNGLFSEEDSLAETLTSFLNRWAANDLVPLLNKRLAELRPMLLQAIRDRLGVTTPTTQTVHVRKSLVVETDMALRLTIWNDTKLRAVDTEDLAALAFDLSHQLKAEFVEKGAFLAYWRSLRMVSRRS
jgi:hypothetical protein